MAYIARAERALDVVSPVVVYRQIGRRPSALYVDDPMTAEAGVAGRHRLSDRVYWRTQAAPGDQIQERSGGVLLVTAAGRCFPIRLAEPTPITPSTAFAHADLTIKADRTLLEQLIAAGALTEASPRRPKRPPVAPADTTFAEDHPLVVDELPAGVSLDEVDGADGGRSGRRRSHWYR